MKLRIRSVQGKETFKIEIPTTSTLDQLKTLIAAHISPLPTSSSSTPLLLSLNRKDELVSSPDQTLQTLAISSGDLVFYAFSPTPQTLTPPPIPRAEEATLPPPPPMSVDEAPTVARNPPEEKTDIEQALAPNPPAPDDAVDESLTLAPNPMGEKPEDDMEVDEDSIMWEKTSTSIPGFLKKVLEKEMGNVSGDLGLLAIAVHAIFLESGFVAHNNNGSPVAQGWASTAPVLSISYTVPDLVGPNCDVAVQTVGLKFLSVGKFADVYGSLNRGSDCYRLCLDLSRFVPSVVSSVGMMSEKDEREIFELWKTVKDKLSLPLLIDICEKNGLPSPPCFMCLPTELKIMLLEFLPGVDVARVNCVSLELRYLSSNDELWKQKFIQEFGLLDERELLGRRWKDKFVICWEQKKNARRRPIGLRSSGLFFQGGPFPFGSPAFNIIGGDYDLYPNVGGIRQDFPRFPARRTFVRHYNLGFNA